jgi:hypothetical protein
MSAMWKRRIFGFAFAIFVAASWASIVQTQFNLAALQALGAEVSFALRMQTTAQDLVGFGPLFAAVAAVAFALAFPLAGFATRRMRRAGFVLFAVAGWIALIVAVKLIDAVVPPPVLIAATRSIGGLLLTTLGGAIAGGLFAHVSGSRGAPRRTL